MLNEIIKGVSVRLYDSFGDAYRIYQNDVEQGLKEPCFFIQILEPSRSPLLGQRSMVRIPLDISYFPRRGGNNDEMLSVGWQLMEQLEYITLPNGDTVRGTKMTFEVVDGVLHFFVGYNMTILHPEDKQFMDTVDMDVSTQGG